MVNKTEQQVNELGQAFANAQQNGDVAALQELLTEDFRLVGPFGFVLDKQQWLQRYRSGALRITSLRWDEGWILDNQFLLQRSTSQESETRGLGDGGCP